MWAFVSAAYTLFVIRKRRGKKVLEEVLGEGFLEAVGCEGYGPYPAVIKRIQCCWAHLLGRLKRCLTIVGRCGGCIEV